MSASQEVLLNRMTSPPNTTDPAIIQAFAKIPALLEQAPGLMARGRFLDCDCLLGPSEQPFHAAIRAGKIVDLIPAPVLMRSWRFAYRATPAAWAEYWQPMPRPGWHDLFALTKRGKLCWKATCISSWPTCNISRTCWRCRGSISQRRPHEC